MNIPVVLPLIESEELLAAQQALELRWLGMGHYVRDFENELSKYLGLTDRYLALTSTGTAAIHLGLVLARVKPGDEVILPSLNFVATAQAIISLGAEPVFCDILEETLCLDVEAAALLCNDKTRAIISVDYSGHLCDYAAIDRLARKHGLRVIHDAAHSFGSTFGREKVGSFSDICIFSFDPIKTLTCIDAGAIIVKSKEELTQIQEMRVVGVAQQTENLYQNKKFQPREVSRHGYRYHVPNLHAAIGLAQLKKIDRIIESRHDIAKRYTERLGKLPGIRVPASDYSQICPFIYYIRVLDGRRDALREYLADSGIETGLHWRPNHQYTYFLKSKRGSLSTTDRVGDELVTIPFYTCMPIEQQEAVMTAIEKFILCR